VYRRKNLFNS